jgi:hypothetical protein
MGIPESQLDTWAHQGAIAGSRDTYASVKNVLEAATTPYVGKSFKVFLQGSYCNDTNIYAESDVDVIIRLDSCFQSDLSLLKTEEKEAWETAHSDATYSHTNFRGDVLSALKKAFGDDVVSGDKAIAIRASGNRRKADVITAIEYRRYYNFHGQYDQNYDSGICFYDKALSRIANYPKQHSDNMTTKHQSSKLRLKPMVRILKNMRSRLVSDGLLEAGVAPSYYIEGLLYNVPDEHFSYLYSDCFANAINWIQTKADKNELLCANRQYYLLRDNSKTCWRPSDCEKFLRAVIHLWNTW